MRTGIVLLVLAAAAPAAAQPQQPASGSAFISATASIARFQPPAQNASCAPPGNRGIFCGAASGMSPRIAGEAGVFLSRFVALAAEGSLSRKRSGFATYDQQSHTDYNVTTASLLHSAERGISGLVFGHIPVGTRGAAVEPVAGGALVFATDSLTGQVRVAGPAGFPRVTSSVADTKTHYSAKGFVVGLGGSTRPAKGVAFVGSVRARWLNWPQVLANSYRAFASSGSTQLAPASVGRWALLVSAGIRWTSQK